MPLFKKQIKNGGPVTLTHPEMVRYFMTIPEAVQLVIQAGAMAKGGEIFILDMGKPVKIADLAHDLIRLSGLEPGRDIKVKYTGIRPGEKLFEELLSKEEGASATKHDRIYVGVPLDISGERLHRFLHTLSAVTDSDKVGAYLKQLVPTFVPYSEQVQPNNVHINELLRASLDVVAALDEKGSMEESTG